MVLASDEQHVHGHCNVQGAKTSCHKTNTDAVSHSDELLSHVLTVLGALRLSCHRMNMSVVFHRHAPFVRGVKQSFEGKMTCRIENTYAVSPSDEPSFHVCEDNQIAQTSCHIKSMRTVSASD